jgi:tetratricopeptide (TPR) repeat protein
MLNLRGYPMRLRLFPILLLAAAGCAQTAAVKPAKETASEHWNQARAGVLLSLSQDQYKSGNFDKCRETLNDAMKFDPKSGPLRVMSGRLYIEQGQLEAAERELKMARDLDPRSAEADYLSGVIYQRWQKPDVAYECYTSACEKAPAELAFLLARSEMLVAMNRTPEALAMLEEKIVYFEHSATIRDAVGQMLIQQGKFPEACAMIKEASVLTPDDPTLREHLGLALFYDKEYRESAVVLTRLLQEPDYTSRPDLQTTLAECQFQLGHFKDARDCYEIATKLDPGSAGTWLGLAKCAMQMNDVRRTELSLKKCIAIDPGAAESRLLLGYLRLKQERYEDALAEFSKVSNDDHNDTLSLCMIGYILEKLGRNDEAIHYYGQALKIKPDDELATKLMAAVNVHE